MDPVHLVAAGISRSFEKQWVFQNLNGSWMGPGIHALVGANGSGKSTLLKILLGFVRPNQGQVQLFLNNKPLPPQESINHMALAGPYLELPEELSLQEFLSLLHQLRPSFNPEKAMVLLQKSGLEPKKNQPMAYFSSGMKQRVRLLSVFTCQLPVWLLDEPLSNLDQAGKDFYSSVLSSEKNNRLILVASNHQVEEFPFALSTLHLN